MVVCLGIYNLLMIYTLDNVSAQNGKAEVRVGKSPTFFSNGMACRNEYGASVWRSCVFCFCHRVEHSPNEEQRIPLLLMVPLLPAG